MTSRSEQIRKAIEAKGYTVSEIHYLRPGAHLEKGGQEGGWIAFTDNGDVEGWTYQDVIDEVAGWPHADEEHQP